MFSDCFQDHIFSRFYGVHCHLNNHWSSFVLHTLIFWSPITTENMFRQLSLLGIRMESNYFHVVFLACFELSQELLAALVGKEKNKNERCLLLVPMYIIYMIKCIWYRLKNYGQSYWYNPCCDYEDHHTCCFAYLSTFS